TTEVGHPEVPVIRQMIALPHDCDVSIEVTATDSVTFSGPPVYPAPEIVTRYTPEGWEYLEEEFARDGGAYQDSTYYPPVVASIEDPGSLRGQGVALLAIRPVRYRASAEETVVLTSLTVSLSFKGGRGGIAESIGPMQGIADDIILNYEGFGGGPPRGGRGAQWQVCNTLGQCDSLQTDYLMIVEDSLPCTTHVDSLARHRATFNGYNVAIVPSGVVVDYHGQGQMSDEAIRHFIVDLYNTRSAEHMADGHLGNVLLVGDAEEGDGDALLPAHEYPRSPVNDTPDWYYACVDGFDQYADLSLGRLCARDTTELRREVQRFIEYEQTASSSQEWRDDVLLSCGFAWIEPPECSESDEDKATSVHASFDTVAAILDRAGAVYDTHQVHTHSLQEYSTCYWQNRAAAHKNMTQVNSGRHIVELCAHGWAYGTYAFRPA
ncbi:MAG: hypothetical protein GF400_09750, partial [Candidatus Eisenbacteria bacterium]|nr:hypothetical protein [Candidatus Eisenbacteria bacterium]